MTFSSPLLLLTLLVVPLAIAGWVLLQRRRARYAIAFTNLDVLASVVATGRPWRRIVPLVLALLALALLCVGVARPQVTVRGDRTEGTVILLVDVSRSMVARDVKPSRLGAARIAIREFLRKIPRQFAVGIISFSSEPNVVSPVTTDRNVTDAAVSYLLPEGGTAIGDAIARAVQVGKASQRSLNARPSGRNAPLSILMLSDGAQRTGFLQPEQGAERARAAGYRIYTIALGTPNGVVNLNFRDFGRSIPVPPDPATLKRISAITGGEFFAAPSADALKSAYQKVRATVATAPRKAEATVGFVVGGAALLLVSGLLSAFWSSRLP
jgi:Ca-activated chloride channel homolog